MNIDGAGRQKIQRALQWQLSEMVARQHADRVRRYHTHRRPRHVCLRSRHRKTRFVTAGTIESWIDNDHILGADRIPGMRSPALEGWASASPHGAVVSYPVLHLS